MRPLEARIEQALGVEQLAQSFDAGEQLAEADRANLG